MILLFHVCSGIRISSPFHLSTFQMPIQNLKSPKTLKTQDFLSTYLKWSLNCVVFDLCRLCTSSFFFNAMLLNLLTIPQMWIMFISKRSDLFPIIHIQEPWEPLQDVLGLCPPVTPVTASLSWIWRDHSTLLHRGLFLQLNISKKSELMDEMISTLNTLVEQSHPPARQFGAKTTQIKDDRV